MTYKPRNPDPHPRQDEDIVPTRKIALIGLGALIVFAIGIAWSTWIWARSPRAERPPDEQRIPLQVGRPEIGNVFQRTFDLTDTASRTRQKEQQHLESYGWVDRPNQLIHVPIDRAMERVIAGERP